MGVYDVPSQDLMEIMAKDFKEKLNVQKPAFTEYVKTGMGRERAPNNPDWYYFRMASILYRVYKEGPLGTGSLRTYYGNRKNRGRQPHIFTKASGKIIRQCLQSLEVLGFVRKDKKGRTIAPKGQSYLNEKAKFLASNPLVRPPKKERPKSAVKQKQEQKQEKPKGKKGKHEEKEEKGKKGK